MNFNLENNVEVLNMVLLKDISGGLYLDILVTIARERIPVGMSKAVRIN